MKIEDLFKVSRIATYMIVLIRNGKRKIISSLSKEANTTYSHGVRIVKELKEAGLVTIEPNGRSKYVELTPKGIKIANHLQEIKLLLC